MTATSRRLKISQRAVDRGEVSLADLAAEFSVSEMTIRRDLDGLESQGVVRKVIGGAISTVGKSTEPPFAARAILAADKKVHLAQAAVKLLTRHETVILDSGSTILAVAREIRGKDLALTIVTPSVLVALELADEPDTIVLLTGGRVRPGEMSLIGSEAEDAFLRYNCDVYLMGVAGLDSKRGASEYHIQEGAVKRYAVGSADRVIAVVDQGKLGRVQLINVANVDEIDAVVTDAAELHPEVLRFRAANIDVHCVG